MKYIVIATNKFNIGYCVACGEKCANDCTDQTGCSKLINSSN